MNDSMITASPYCEKTIAVFGLARTGRSAAKALTASGATVMAWDDDTASCAAANAMGIQVANLYDMNWSAIDGLMLAPGVPLTHPQPHPLVLKARKHGCSIFCDMEIFAQARAELPVHKVIAITGTNGKSTTTALIHHILKSAQVPTLMGGNIGLPILDQNPLPEGGVYVLELSSFQIDLTQSLAADVAVLLNITPDHLDRHGDMAGYVAAKARLFEMQTTNGVAVIGSDSYCQSVANTIDRKIILISSSDPDVQLNQPAWPTLQGPHNAENAAAAIAACLIVGVARQDIFAALKTYPGLPHRMERVSTVKDVLYINDSKATNPDSTAPALAAYPHIHWIVGGKRKADDLNACLPHLGHVRAAYLIGSSEAVFETALAPHVRTMRCGTLAGAVISAAAAAKPGEVVLLSPAAASQDQFKDYEERGQLFRTLVAALEDVRT